MSKLQIFIVSVLFLLMLPSQTSIQAQTASNVQCGSIVDSEITPDIQREGEYYSISLAPGDKIQIEAIPYADTFAIYIGLYDPTDRRITYRDHGLGVTANLDVEIPATGNYKIHIAAPSYRYIGAYTMYVGCTLRDGTVIEAGSVQPTSVPVTSAPPIPQPQVTLPAPTPSFGFAGVNPVDFTAGVTVPLNFEAPNTGSISPGFAGIFGYEFQGNAGDSISFQFTRNGNLNVGIAIISQNNTLVFQSVITSSDFLLTGFTLPETATYTIGVFSYDGFQPPDAQNTPFEIVATMN